MTPSFTARLDRRRGLALSSVQFGGERFDRHPAARPFRRHRPAGRLVHRRQRVRSARRTQNHGSGMVRCAAVARRRAICLPSRASTRPRGPSRRRCASTRGEPQIDFDLTFHWDDWGKGSLRLGHLTLLPDAFDWDKLSLTTHNGGKDCETFRLAGETVDHGAPVSFLVSASHGLGMTEGWAELGDDREPPADRSRPRDRAAARSSDPQARGRQPVLPIGALGPGTRRHAQTDGLAPRSAALSFQRQPRPIKATHLTNFCNHDFLKI